MADGGYPAPAAPAAAAASAGRSTSITTTTLLLLLPPPPPPAAACCRYPRPLAWHLLFPFRNHQAKGDGQIDRQIDRECEGRNEDGGRGRARSLPPSQRALPTGNVSFLSPGRPKHKPRGLLKGANPPSPPAFPFNDAASLSLPPVYSLSLFLSPIFLLLSSFFPPNCVTSSLLPSPNPSPSISFSPTLVLSPFLLLSSYPFAPLSFDPSFPVFLPLPSFIPPPSAYDNIRITYQTNSAPPPPPPPRGHSKRGKTE